MSELELFTVQAELQKERRFNAELIADRAHMKNRIRALETVLANAALAWTDERGRTPTHPEWDPDWLIAAEAALADSRFSPWAIDSPIAASTVPTAAAIRIVNTGIPVGERENHADDQALADMGFSS